VSLFGEVKPNSATAAKKKKQPLVYVGNDRTELEIVLFPYQPFFTDVSFRQHVAAASA